MIDDDWRPVGYTHSRGWGKQQALEGMLAQVMVEDLVRARRDPGVLLMYRSASRVDSGGVSGG